MIDIDRLNHLVLEVFRLNGVLLASGDALVAPFRLTSARWQVMGALAYAATPLPVAHIARNMGLTRQGVQRLVNEMVAAGLVDLADNPHHSRAKLVRLTPAGETAYAAANAAWELIGAAACADLDAAAIDAATATLNHLRRHFERGHADGH